MTTIAVRDGIVAADRMISGGGTALGTRTKIEKIGRAIAAATGTGHLAARFVSWVRCGCKGLPPEMSQKYGEEGVHDATGIIILPDRIITFIPEGYQWCDHGLIAFGSGGDIARGAMGFGASAIQAIEVASMFDLYTGAGIDVLRLD